jgi:hypothetical protein
MTKIVNAEHCHKLMYPLQKAHEMCIAAYYSESEYFKEVAMEHLKALKELLNSMEDI